MKRNVSIAISLCLLASASSMAAELETYTWALDRNSNSEGFDYLLGNNPIVSSNRPAPSSVPLNTDMASRWMVDGRVDPGAEFTAIYRTRSHAVKAYPEGAPPPVTFNNWAFIRKMIFMGGEQDTGAHVIAPDPNWVSAAHENGVKIYGTVYIDAEKGNDGMVNTLIGSLKDPWNWDATELADFNIDALLRLEEIAKQLKLDGWFLNIEQGFANSNSQDTIQMRRLLNHIFPKLKARGVEFIVYTGSSDKTLGGVVTDAHIADFGKTNPTFHGLDLALGIDPEYTKKKFEGQEKTYLMYLDEVFLRNTPKGRTWPLRIKAAQATQCQYFNGAGEWPGFKQYAQARYPIGKDETALCGGDTSSPLPTTVVKINLQSVIPDPWTNPNEQSWQVTAKNSGQQCAGNCYLEFSEDGLQAEVLEFNNPLEYQANATSWVSTRSDIVAWSGWPDNDPRINFLDPLFAQYMPAFKWWEKEAPRTSNDGRGNIRSNNVIDIHPHVWNYRANPVSNPQQGVTCNRVTAEQAAHYGVAQDRSCILQVPTYKVVEAIPSYSNGYEAYGQFPLLDLVMQINREGFSYYNFYNELWAKGTAPQ